MTPNISMDNEESVLIIPSPKTAKTTKHQASLPKGKRVQASIPATMPTDGRLSTYKKSGAIKVKNAETFNGMSLGMDRHVMQPGYPPPERDKTKCR